MHEHSDFKRPQVNIPPPRGWATTPNRSNRNKEEAEPLNEKPAVPIATTMGVHTLLKLEMHEERLQRGFSPIVKLPPQNSRFVFVDVMGMSMIIPNITANSKPPSRFVHPHTTKLMHNDLPNANQAPKSASVPSPQTQHDRVPSAPTVASAPNTNALRFSTIPTATGFPVNIVPGLKGQYRTARGGKNLVAQRWDRSIRKGWQDCYTDIARQVQPLPSLLSESRTKMWPALPADDSQTRRTFDGEV